MNVQRLLYNVQAWFARHFLSEDTSPGSISLKVGIGYSVEVAICNVMPYYDELLAKLQDAKKFWELSDAALAPYEIRFVPAWFDVILCHEPWDERPCMGVTAMDVREIRVSFKGEKTAQKEWERTLVHEFAHVYCHEHPEFGAAWDPMHRLEEVWKRADAYHFGSSKT